MAKGTKINESKLQNFVSRQAFPDDIEAAKRYDRYKKSDPFPDIDSALLNSEDILNYVYATGMISPFHPENLSGATYEVGLAGTIIYWDENNQECSQDFNPGETFVLKKHTIAFITLEPVFRIPHYLALRFNLKIQHIYKGLLLGTGPLVDPGFCGKLSIPLHNLTANDYKFTIGDGLIKLEFTKLSHNRCWGDSGDVQIKQDDLLILTDIRPNRGVKEYITNALSGNPVNSIQSAIYTTMLENTRKAKEAQESAKRTETLVKFGGAAGIIIAIATLLFALFPIAQTFVSDINNLNKTIIELTKTVDNLSQKNEQSESQIQALKETLRLMKETQITTDTAKEPSP